MRHNRETEIALGAATDRQIDRYLRIVAWAKRRYTRRLSDGRYALLIRVGDNDGPYKRLERLAWERVMLGQ